MLYLIRRGRENLRLMTKDTFSVSCDATGKRFISQQLSELDKKHSIHDDGHETPGDGRIYESGGKMCPVKTFEKYLSHLHPMENSLWQRPLEKVNTGIWYYRAPLGEKTLGSMMVNISLKYKLSERYTNHSVRVTSLQLLDDNGVEGRHICKISGHKSTDSLNSYARKLSSARKRNISSIISTHVCPESYPPGPATKRNFKLVPDGFQKFRDDAQFLQPANPPAVDFEIQPNVDEEFFQSIPNNLLTAENQQVVPTHAFYPSTNYQNIPNNNNVLGENNTNNITATPFSFPSHPFFNNCDNCTVNFHIYHK